MSTKKEVRDSLRQAASRLRSTLGKGILLEGSLCRVRSTGAAHYQLTWKEDGKTKTLYIPKAHEQRAREAIERWRESRELLRQIGALSREWMRLECGAGDDATKRCRTEPKRWTR